MKDVGIDRVIQVNTDGIYFKLHKNDEQKYVETIQK
jgi:hypothetical protein